MEEYKAHINLSEIGISGQEEIAKASVAIVGIGGLGCPALQCLASAGIGKLVLIDGDAVEESNLARQFLFGRDDIGSNKANIAADRLGKLHPTIELIPIDCHLDSENAEELLSECNVVLDCTDDLMTSYIIDEVCSTFSIPMVFAAVHKHQGQITVFHDQNGFVLGDLFTNDLKNANVSCSETGVLGTVTAIFGTFQANEALKIVVGFGEVLSGKVLIMDMRNLSHQTIELKKHKLKTSNYMKQTDDMGISAGQVLALSQQEREKIEIFDLSEEAIEVWDSRLKLKKVFLGEIKEELSRTPAGNTIVLICEQDKKSKAVLQMAGKSFEHINVYYLKGGTNALKEKYEEGIH